MSAAYAAMNTCVLSPGKVAVLVVEDEILMRAVLADELRDEGYLVIEAASGDEALSVLQSNMTVDIVITDKRMPGAFDGAALAYLIRTEHPNLKVIMISGDTPDQNLRQVLDGYFRKPCDISALITCLRGLSPKRR